MVEGGNCRPVSGEKSLMKRMLASAVLLTLAVAFAAAGEKTTVSGVLMDKACSAENKTTEKALKHSKDCALMEDCVKSGYGVLTADGKYIAFDAAGNKKAAAFVKKFKGDDSIKIQVDGTLEGSTLKVATIKGE